MKKYKISSRSQSENNSSKTIIPMTNRMYETLRGAVLGDGSLLIGRHGINAYFSYTSKSFQHIHYVVKDFLNYGPGIRSNDIYDERTHKIYHKYQFTTVVSPTFTEEYYKWYIDRVKHIPEDLVLTPQLCKVWYLGDGCLRNMKNNVQDIVLCTNCFEKNEIEEILLPQLKQFDAKLYYVAKLKNGKDSYAIEIGKKLRVADFLDYIGDCPVDDYRHKWNIKPKLLNGSQGKYNIFADEWIQLYKDGESIETIASKYGATYKAVENTLINHWVIK